MLAVRFWRTVFLWGFLNEREKMLAIGVKSDYTFLHVCYVMRAD